MAAVLPDDGIVRAMDNPTQVRKELQTPRAAALAGIVFALILGAVIFLTRSASLSQQSDATLWLSPESRRSSVSTALSLVPFAGIAFLWFIGVIRSRLGASEDRLFATVFLGSGLLFVALLFVTAAVLGTILAIAPSGQPVPTESVRMLSSLSSVLMGSFGTRMAAVFTLVVTTAARRAGLLPKWLVVVGYLFPIVLLVSPPSMRWIVLLFPTWVMLLSIHILVVDRNRRDGGAHQLGSDWAVDQTPTA